MRFLYEIPVKLAKHVMDALSGRWYENTFGHTCPHTYRIIAKLILNIFISEHFSQNKLLQCLFEYDCLTS